jgi:hypothetical protein
MLRWSIGPKILKIHSPRRSVSRSSLAWPPSWCGGVGVAGTGGAPTGAELARSAAASSLRPPATSDSARRPTRDRAKGNLQTRSWCAKAYENALHRGRLQQLLARVEVRGAGRHPFDCAQCGRHCVPGENGVAPHATNFCCRRHKGQMAQGSEQGGVRALLLEPHGFEARSAGLPDAGEVEGGVA